MYFFILLNWFCCHCKKFTSHIKIFRVWIYFLEWVWITLLCQVPRCFTARRCCWPPRSGRAPLPRLHSSGISGIIGGGNGGGAGTLFLILISLSLACLLVCINSVLTPFCAEMLSGNLGGLFSLRKMDLAGGGDRIVITAKFEGICVNLDGLIGFLFDRDFVFFCSFSKFVFIPSFLCVSNFTRKSSPLVAMSSRIFSSHLSLIARTGWRWSSSMKVWSSSLLTDLFGKAELISWSGLVGLEYCCCSSVCSPTSFCVVSRTWWRDFWNWTIPFSGTTASSLSAIPSDSWSLL